MRRMRTEKWIKSTTTTNLTKLSLRRKRRLNWTPRPSHTLSEVLTSSLFVDSLPVVVNTKLLLSQYFTHSSTPLSFFFPFTLNTSVPFRAACCTFTAICGLSAFDSLDHNIPSHSIGLSVVTHTVIPIFSVCSRQSGIICLSQAIHHRSQLSITRGS